ncbi:hypothetical protein HK098_003677 [Nowakowskiella sp. JEL0407]|nr:hypothetical protein HK098_003677 [Nowakowskiella sp. JEL0407]
MLPVGHTRLKVLGVTVSDKVFLYLLAFQLTLSSYPNSLVAACCGLLSGILYKANVGNMKKWRIPLFLSNFAKSYFRPWIESPPARNRPSAPSLNPNFPSERPTAPRSQQPREEDVQTLMGMGFDRERVVAALSTGANVESAASLLLEGL